MHKNAQKCRHVTGSLCLFRVAGGTRVLHPRALLHHVHVCQRVGHTWPKYPAALLPSVEVQSHNTCPSSCVWAFGFTKETSRLFLGFSTGLLMVQRWCTILWAWWTLTFSTTARRSPGVSWAFIWSLSSIISTGELELLCPNFMAEVSRIVFDIVWTYFHVVVWSTPWWASNKHVFWGYERRTGMNSSSLHLYWLSPFCFLFQSNTGQNKWSNLNECASILPFHYPMQLPDRLKDVWKLCEETKNEDTDACDAFDPSYGWTFFLKGWILPHAARSTHCESPI